MIVTGESCRMRPLWRQKRKWQAERRWEREAGDSGRGTWVGMRVTNGDAGGGGRGP